MNNKKIRTYNELNIEEKTLLDTMRTMKLSCDQARFELFSYKLTNLIETYEESIELRKDAQATLFDILEELDKNELSAIYVSYEELGKNREAELNNINTELNIIKEYNVGFNEALNMIYSGVAEEILINEENNW